MRLIILLTVSITVNEYITAKVHTSVCCCLVIQRFQGDQTDRQRNESVRYLQGTDSASRGQVQGAARETASDCLLPLPEQFPHSPLRAGHDTTAAKTRRKLSRADDTVH